MATNLKTYDFFTGTYKQGDDLSNCLDVHNNDVVKAFEELARLYKDAANKCLALAKALEQDPTATVIADTHAIQVQGSEDVFEKLVGGNGSLLEECDYMDEEEEYYDEEEDPFNDDEDFDNSTWQDDGMDSL